MFEQGGWTFPHAVELERPLKLVPGETYKVRIFVDDTVVILYVNDDVALSARAYDLRARKFGLIAADGSVTFRNTALYTR
jgi:beta-fructofuranosidase